MYVYLARLSTVLLHRLETEARRAAFETAAATGAEAATRGRCADAGAAVALFLGRGVVVHAVAGDVLAVHAGRGCLAGVVLAAGGILARGGAVRWLGLAAVELGCGHVV